MEVLRAIFERRLGRFCSVPVAIERVIRISGEELDRLFEKPYLEYDFIAKHIDDMYVDEKGVFHALLVMSDERADGLLIESEGVRYARYASYVPCTAIVTSPALAELVSTMKDIVNFLVLQGSEKDENELCEVHLDALDNVHAVSLARNPLLQETLLAMLLEREEIAQAEIKEGRLFLKYEPEIANSPQLEL